MRGGLSTRDVEDAFRDATGELLISKTAVSGITDRLYLFVDAIFESLRRQGGPASCLVHRLRRTQTPAAPGRGQQGKPILLDRLLPQHAHPRHATAHHRHLRRSTRADQGHHGVLPRQHPDPVGFHRLGNLRAKLPDETAGEVLAHVYAVRDAPTLNAARVAADRFANTYSREYPAAVACFTEDLEALLAIHRVPVRHRIRMRTTNLAERSFTEERRRTKVIPRLMDEQAAMKLVYATMIRAADRWCRVSITDLERHQLTLLRAELGLDPPPGNTDDRKTNQQNLAACSSGHRFTERSGLDPLRCSCRCARGERRT
jgi:putative transposase